MTVMARCVLCGGENDEAVTLCLHHVVGDHDWAFFNRLFCDFVHRGIVPPRPPAPESEEQWVTLDVESDNEAMAIL
jgi:hypothetical protein